MTGSVGAFVLRPAERKLIAIQAEMSDVVDPESANYQKKNTLQLQGDK